jgi:hypothetical protein
MYRPCSDQPQHLSFFNVVFFYEYICYPGQRVSLRPRTYEYTHQDTKGILIVETTVPSLVGK